MEQDDSIMVDTIHTSTVSQVRTCCSELLRDYTQPTNLPCSGSVGTVVSAWCVGAGVGAAGARWPGSGPAMLSPGDVCPWPSSGHVGAKWEDVPNGAMHATANLQVHTFCGKLPSDYTQTINPCSGSMGTAVNVGPA